MAKTTLNSLSDALSVRLIKGALPGELQGFGKTERADAARFVAATAERRAPGTAVIALEPLGTAEPGSELRRRMRLAIVNDDMPFLVDSIAATISSHDISIDRIIHPVLRIARDPAGALTEVDPAAGGDPESMIYIELERADARERRDLVASLERNLADVRAAVRDWPALQRAMAEDVERLPEGEGRALLEWLLLGNFTLLGRQSWSGETVEALGIACNEQPVPILAEASRILAIAWFERGGEAPLLLKSNLIATVHRHVPLDLALVPVMAGKARRRPVDPCRAVDERRAERPTARRSRAARAADGARAEVRLRPPRPYRQGADARAGGAAARPCHGLHARGAGGRRAHRNVAGGPAAAQAGAGPVGAGAAPVRVRVAAAR